MVRYLLKTFLPLILLAVSTMMPAQGLPQLGNDGAITSGALTNGITYYLVTNPVKKGMADFALLRRGFCDTLTARKELATLPHFNRTAPYKFLSRKGIGCGKEGFISFRDDNTLFRFTDVPVFDQAASDTTLLMLFDLIAEQPCQHSVIIAGDINPAGIIQKMSVFSLMVPSRSPVYNPQPQDTSAHNGLSHSFSQSEKSSVSIGFRSPRTPPEMMRTIQPFIVKSYALQLALIAKKRLEEKLAARNIPYSGISADFTGSDSCPGDERFDVRVETSGRYLDQASLALASTLSALASKGVGEAEFVNSKKAVFSRLLSETDNSSIVDRCVSSVLYGSDLATTASKIQFLTSRAMDSKREAGIFNNFSEALLGDLSDAHLCWSGNEEDYDDWLSPTLFRSTWEAVAMLDKPEPVSKVTAADTLSLSSAKDKVKLKSSETEPVSGGQMWIFSNGLKVIFKKTTADKSFNYSLMLRGGYASVKNLQRGEGAFFSDLLFLSDVAGMKGQDFRNMLTLNGIEMNANVSVTDMRISGSAPAGKLSLLMKSLLSLANDRHPDDAAFGNYLRTESARLAPAHIDSLLYPGYNLTQVKSPSGLRPQTQGLASAYFDKQFLKVNDGVLVLMGDLNPDYVQKFLCRCLGGFRTSSSTVLRQSVQFSLPAGSSTYTQNSSPSSISIAIAAAAPFTIENSVAFRIAVQALHRSLSGVMAQKGFTVSSSHRIKLNPQESIEAVFTLTPVPECGMPLGIKGGKERMMEALLLARKTIDEVLSKPLPDAEFNACKSIQTSYCAAEIAAQANYVNAVVMRYSNAKDVLTGFNDRAGSVGPQQVQSVFGMLAGGRRIEYVIK